MKGLALEFYVSTTYGGIIGIFNGKWVKAMRAFRSVAAALLHDFYLVDERRLMILSSTLKQLVYIQFVYTGLTISSYQHS